MTANKTYYLVFSLMILSSVSRAQNLLNFNRVMDGVTNQFGIHDTIIVENLILLEYKSEDNNSHCQLSIYPNGMKSLFCFDPQIETSYYYEVDSMDRISLFSTITNIKLVAYRYYPSGKLESYSIEEEDTLFNNHTSFSQFRLTSNSFTFKYNENGTTESVIYYTPGVQDLIIYWPNKRKKIVAEYNANRFSYCGNYEEFDEDGNLLMKGTYYLSDDPLSRSVKIGVWKYYESGRLKKKEKHRIN